MKLDDPMERDALAAEYALGTLTGAERQAFAAQAAQDVGLSRLVRAWEERLSGLNAIVPAVEPTPGLWERIAESIGEDQSEVVQLRPKLAASRAQALGRQEPDPLRRLRRQVWRWRIATGAMAAALAAGVVLARIAPDLLAPGTRYPVPLVAVLQPADAPGGWLIRAEAGPGRAVIQPIRQPRLQAGRDFELWAVPEGGAAPVALGLLNPQGATVLPLDLTESARLAPDALLAVSVEPKGGSPTGSPTGPIVFSGRIARLPAE